MSQDGEKQLETIRILTETFEDIKCDLIGQYQISHLIGSGAYGSVWKATSFYTNGDVAVKRIKNKKHVEYCLKRTLREIKILRHFKHGNIVSLHDVIINESSLYLVLDLMETDLHKIIHSAQPLSLDHVKWFLYQLLRALKYLHSANVVHRDIKPSNLLVNSNCLLKLADFGMARCLNDLDGPKGSDKGDGGASDASSDILSPASVGSHTSNCSTSSNTATTANTGKNGAAKLEATIYVATRWYRSPELILCHAEYTTSIDMWSVGCILAELLLRRPLFPGKTQVNQLNLIISVLGHPRKTFVDKIKSDPIKAYMNSMPKNNRPISLREKIPNCNSKEALDLIQRLLIWEPSDRLPSELALAHSFIVKHHRPAEEPICCKDYDYAFENSLAGADQLNEAVAIEIQKFASFRKRKLKKEFSSTAFSSEAEKEANKIFPQRNPSLWQGESKTECMEASEESAALARSKKEHSLEVKAKLRAAILSDEWRSKGKRRTRTGRPKNSKITKKKDSEPIVLTSTKRAASNLSTPKELPSLSTEELGAIAQMKTNNRPITLKIVTAGNGNEGSDKRLGNVLTLSFSSPKAHLMPKQGRFVVPKVTNSKYTTLIPVVSGTNKDGVKTVVNRGGLMKNVIITSKIQPKKVLKPNVVAVPTTNPTPKVFSIPKVVHNESLSSVASNQSNSTTTSNAQILPQHAFRFKAVGNKVPAFHAQSSSANNSILLPVSCSTGTALNAQNWPSIMEVYNAPKNPASSADGSEGQKATSKTTANRTSVTIPSVSSIPIDHSSYPVSFKGNSITLTTTGGISSVSNKTTSMLANRSEVNKMPISSIVRPVNFTHTPRIQPAPDIRYKPAAVNVQNSNGRLIPQLASPRIVTASKVPMFIEDDDDDDEQSARPGMMGNDDVTAGMNSNGIHPCLRLPSMALMENGDAPMVSAMTLSQKSSASTVPGNDNEMEDLIHKLSSSSLRNDINPFAEFLDIPLSAVLTANEDKPNEFLSENPNLMESLQQYSSQGGAFIPEPEGENMGDDRLLMWNDDTTSCDQSLGLSQETYDSLVSNDCRSIFDISSAEMQEIENELKKDFSCLDFSLLELDSPT